MKLQKYPKQHTWISREHVGFTSAWTIRAIEAGVREEINRLQKSAPEAKKIDINGIQETSSQNTIFTHHFASCSLLTSSYPNRSKWEQFGRGPRGSFGLPGTKPSGSSVHCYKYSCLLAVLPLKMSITVSLMSYFHHPEPCVRFCYELLILYPFTTHKWRKKHFCIETKCHLNYDLVCYNPWSWWLVLGVWHWRFVMS